MSDTRSNTSRDSQDSKFSKILEEIKNDPKLVKSHRFKMKKYNDVITAKDLISWLIQKNYCKNRNLAISLIQEMLENQLLKLIVSENKDSKEVKDDNSLYKISSSELTESPRRPSFLIMKKTKSHSDGEKFLLNSIFTAIDNADSEYLITLFHENDCRTHLTSLLEAQTPLHAAISKGNFIIAEMLIKEYQRFSLDLNIQDKQGWTPLHCAANIRQGTLDDDYIIRALLNIPQVRADIPNEDGNLPLHFFVSCFINSTCTEIGEELIKKAPESVNRANKMGETPLHKAIFNNATRLLMVKLLVKHKADVNCLTIRNQTALHYAVEMRRRDLIKILLQAGADTTKKELQGQKTPAQIAQDNKLDDICELFKQVDELYQFLKKLKIEEFILEFQKQTCYLDVLAEASNEELDELLEKLKIETIGVRLRFKRAVEELRETRVKKKSVTKSTYQPGELKRLKQKTIVYNDLEFTKEIGSGAYGKVFKGLYRKSKVAIKVLMQLDANNGFKEFQQECEVLAALNHPNIVNFVGACYRPQTCIVLEYCSLGNLTSYMQKDNEISWTIAFLVVKGACAGLLALHNREPPIYHRDIKSDNILLTDLFEVKLSDMGLARFFEEGAATFDRVVGTFAYLAPERYRGETFTAKSDIYSMAIVFWELAFRVSNKVYQKPFGEYPGLKPEFKIAVKASENDLRPTVPENVPVKFHQLIELCWHKDPAVRPTAKEMYEKVVEIMNENDELNDNESD